MMLTKPTDTPAVAAEKVKRPKIGDDVHFFDNTRAQQYSQPGAGPYAAKVVLLGIGGVQLKVFAPHAVFDAEKVPHKSELDPGKAVVKRWWQWPHETKAEPAQPERK
jgi:hypothetical protein